MKNILNIIIVALIFNYSYGQQFTDLYGDYLGQKPPVDTPLVFAPNLISTKYLEHSSAVFSKDGKIVVWCSVQNDIKKLWQMQRVNNRWTKPEVLDLFNDNCMIWSDGPFFLPGTNRLFFNSPREKSDGRNTWKVGENKVWYVDIINGNWGKPHKYDLLINNDIGQISITQDSSVYYLGKQLGAWHEIGIFYSKYVDGHYSSPKPMPLEIGKTFQNWTPFISQDESYLIYSKCVDQGDFGDLYITYYDNDKKKWSLPQDLGEPINTWAQERFPYVSPDGKYLFFTRWTKDNDQDVFWVSSDIISKLRLNAKFE